MPIGQKYTDEFKELIVKIVLDNKKTIVELSRDLDINERTLYKWTYSERIYRKNLKNKEFKNLTEEMKKLKKDLYHTKKERDILKKIIKTQL